MNELDIKEGGVKVWKPVSDFRTDGNVDKGSKGKGNYSIDVEGSEITVSYHYDGLGTKKISVERSEFEEDFRNGHVAFVVEWSHEENFLEVKINDKKVQRVELSDSSLVNPDEGKPFGFMGLF